MTPLLCACAVVITLETQRCRKRAPRSVEFNFFINCDRHKRFPQNERRRADIQNLASDFLIFAWGLRPRLHEDDVKTIGTKSYLSGKKSFRIGLLFTRRRSVSANFWRRYEDDRKSGNFWRRYGNDRPSSSCKHHIRIDRSGSYQIVIAMRWPRTQASQSCIFSARVGVSCWRVGLFSESIPSFEARSWQVVAMRHKEEQRRAAAGQLIWSIVAQALLLLLFKALYSTSAGDQELSTTEEKSCCRY